MSDFIGSQAECNNVPPLQVQRTYPAPTPTGSFSGADEFLINMCSSFRISIIRLSSSGFAQLDAGAFFCYGNPIKEKDGMSC